MMYLDPKDNPLPYTSPAQQAFRDAWNGTRQFLITRQIKQLFNAAAEGDLEKVKTLAATIDVTGYKDDRKFGQLGTKNFLMSAALEAAGHGQDKVAGFLLDTIIEKQRPGVQTLQEGERFAGVMKSLQEAAHLRIQLAMREILGSVLSARDGVPYKAAQPYPRNPGGLNDTEEAFARAARRAEGMFISLQADQKIAAGMRKGFT